MEKRHIIDSNVVYSYTLRDIFITLATRGIKVHWSTQIEAEFVRARSRNSPSSGPKAKNVVQLMRIAVPDWRASAGKAQIGRLNLPDPDDQHVLAAAIQIGAGVIVTDNIQHFPVANLAAHGIVALRPDQALCDLHDADPERMIQAAAEMRARMRDPPLSPEAWLERLDTAGARDLASRLRPFAMRL